MTDSGVSRAVRLLRGERRSAGSHEWRLSTWISGALLLALLMLGFLVLDWWRGAHARLIETAPQVRVMDRLTIKLTENQPVRIGRDHLGQAYVRGSVAAGSAAAPEHVEFTLRIPDRADPTKDRIEMRNVATQRRLWLEFENGFQTFAERFEIPLGIVANTRFSLPKGTTITLRNVSREGFDLWTTQGERAGKDCPREAGPFRYRQEPWWAWLWRKFTLELPAGAADRDVVAAHIGGQSTDQHARPMQICLEAALDWEQLRLVYRGDRLFLAIGRDFDRARYPITMELLDPKTGRVLDPRQNLYGFTQIAWPLAPSSGPRERGALERLKDSVFGAERDKQREQVLRSFVAGRSSYAIRFEPRVERAGTDAIQRRITLVPERKIMFQTVAECNHTPLPEGCPIPIADLRHDVEGMQCGTTNDRVFRQCWRLTTPVATFGSGALARANQNSLLPLASGAAAGLIETAVTKWLVLLLALLLTVVFLPRGPSDRFFDGGTPGGFANTVRSLPMRWAFVLTAFGLALAPEIAAVVGSYGRATPWQGLSPTTAMTVLIINWGLSGIALILFTPTAPFSVGLAWLAVTALAAIGSITLASLAVDGPSTHWGGFFLKHKYLFLDSVPPIMTAVAVVSRVRIQRCIRAILLDRGTVVAFARISAPVLLIVCFALWLIIGSQTGVAGFQPIEAGKFVAIILIAAVLVGLVGYAEDMRLRIGWLERAISLAAFGSFAALLIFVPFWRRDFSPVLIVLLLGASVGSIYLFFAALNVLRVAVQRKESRMRIPLAFRPVVHRGVFCQSFWPLKMRRRLAFVSLPFFAVLILTILGTTLIFSPMIYDWGERMLLHVASWPDNNTTNSSRIETITQAMGQGRHVPAQRFIAWYDLDYSQLSPTRRPRAEFRDLEFHVIRSRTEVAYGDCTGTATLDPRSQWLGPWFDSMLQTAVAKIMDVTIGRAAFQALCSPFEPRNVKPAREGEQVEPSGRELNESIAPIEIPVAENDFTTAYMLARYGIGLGLALYLAEVLLVLTVLYGLIRIHLSGSNAASDAHLRQFVGVMLAGSIMLYILQWTLSWSNVLGLLPVMGQPMTWISAGNSHHFFMALPCLFVILLALRLFGRAPSLPRHRFPPRRANQVR